MSPSNRPNLGVKLLAAGLVLAAGTVVRMAQDQPAGTLAVLSVIVLGLGIKRLWLPPSGPPSHTRMDATSAKAG